ncbi:DUF6441 family protein [Bradyrhizobium sp. Pha-3]|uniref:DUF6441 family protein n=1 Tax=Bradyrhizobium sp. Pha-3 TaxID=208375 RepID=UPI0035D527F5
MKLTFSYKPGEFAETIFANVTKPIAKAATAAMRDTADMAKGAGRQSIASAGFSSKWQNALRATVYPRGADSMSPAAFISHKVPHAGVFENGATIQGHPRLWLPIEANLPLAAGGRRLTPKQFAQSVGPLRLVIRAGGNPLLVADVPVGPAGGVLALPSAANSRKGRRARGAYAKQKTRPLPVFVGVPAVQISKKFATSAAVRTAATSFPALYDRHIKEG